MKTEEMVKEDMLLLTDLKRELRAKRKAYNESVKGLKASIQDLEQTVNDGVLALGHTVVCENMMAEYRPTVVIKMKKVSDGNADND